MRLRCVLDTNVMIAALRSDHGASRLWLEAALDRQLEVMVSVPLFLEYEAVMSRPEQLAAFQISAAEVSTVLDAVATVAMPVHLNFQWRPRVRDAADDMVMETAANGGAELLLTFNVRHFQTVGKQFGFEVALPGPAWSRYEKRIGRIR